jgi:hypothetical protein
MSICLKRTKSKNNLKVPHVSIQAKNVLNRFSSVGENIQGVSLEERLFKPSHAMTDIAY